jgi:aryl-alcohol dehydrogenase-like predicted oxidoreductase
MSTGSDITLRQLGTAGPEVFPIGLGCMALSGVYGSADEAESLATIAAALDHGITLLDTGDFYGAGHNEMLIGRALRGRRDAALLSVKFGVLLAPDGQLAGLDGRPRSVKNFAAYSLKRLGVDHIDIYRLARLDPEVPIEETVGAVADLVASGHVRHIGLSEVGVETVRRAHAVHPICDLQIEYSLISRAPESTIFPVLKSLGIAVTAYGVLSRGLLTGSVPSGANDFRAHLPRFTGENLDRNLRLAARLNQLAAHKGVRPAQLAIAWALAQSDSIVPVVGVRQRSQLRDPLAAPGLKLTAAELAELEAAIPAAAVAGTRYDAQQMRALDSEIAAI